MALPFAGPPLPTAPPPILGGANVILDCDLGFDVDDVGDVGALCAYAKLGLARPLAVIVSTSFNYGSPCAWALVNYVLGTNSVLIGQYNGGSTIENSSAYAQQVATTFGKGAGDTKTNYLGHVATYRTALAGAPDGSVTVIMTGPATCFADLLTSAADGISPLTGAQLVAKKVQRVYWEAAWSPGNASGVNGFGGIGYNLGLDQTSARAFVANMPANVPIIWVGDELGWGSFGTFQGGTLGNTTVANAVLAGPDYTRTQSQSPYVYAYNLYGAANSGALSNGKRPAWGQVAVLHAVNGEDTFGLTLAGGTMTIDGSGNNTWAQGTAGRDALLGFKPNSGVTVASAGQLLTSVLALAEPTYPGSPLSLAYLQVSSIKDKSGLGNTVVQTTPAFRPVISQINGKPAIANNGGFLMNRAAASLPIGSAAYSAIWVCQADVIAGSPSLFGFGSLTQYANAYIVSGNGWGQGEQNSAVYATATLDTAAHVVSAVFSGGVANNYAQWLDGTTQSMGNYQGTQTTNSAGTQLFVGGGVGGGSIIGRYGVLIICAGALSSTDRQLAEGYAAWRYGTQALLPGGHPYAAAAPANWTPLNLPNLIVWLDPADLSTLNTVPVKRFP